MGAPCKATPEVVAAIAREVANGMPISHAAALVRVAPNTITNWMKRKEFALVIRQAEAEFMQHKVGLIAEAGANRCNNGFQQWQAAAWLLERKFPEEFALQPRPQASGAGFTLNLQLVGGEQLQIKTEAPHALPSGHLPAIEATSSSSEEPA